MPAIFLSLTLYGLGLFEFNIKLMPPCMPPAQFAGIREPNRRHEGSFKERTAMNFSLTVIALACLAAFCAGLSVRCAWIGRKAQDAPAPAANHRDDEPYPRWFE